ncbi:putative Esterase D [Hibiscus syriacus]|uniref:Esterase D n=1 Tax=Hibiscus syriacus TaxID=106335 RepID=A0A6A3AUW9_HIBSY|nr:putative Esterase D [Hibiscus syriacus]
MDLAPEELQFLCIPDILRESVSIRVLKHGQRLRFRPSLPFHPPDPKSTRIPPISRLFPDPSRVDSPFNLIFLFGFFLLSTAAVVFTVASLYTSKAVSFSSTISAIPKVFKRLFITFGWIALLMFVYNGLMIAFLFMFFIVVNTQNVVLSFLAFMVILVLFLGVHVYIMALWHLASVVSVLEPIYGLVAMKKSYELLKGRVNMACILVFGYLAICAVISGTFGTVVVHGGERYGIFWRILVGGFLVGVLVIVNLVGLLVQSVFYYVCKSYHHQGIDKSALHDHLGGYLGEYVPLKSSIQMENLDT